MKADWCGFGAAEYARQSEALTEQTRARKQDMVGADVIEQMKATAGQDVVDEAIAQVRQRWVKALLQRGDPRSRAVAELLSGDREARARLQALARTSSDPMVTALALQRPCADDSCLNIEASQWSRLEPANLQAWLMLSQDGRGVAPQTQAGYALDRMAAQGRYSRTYEREFKALLLSLPQTETAGLASEAELQLVVGTAAAWANAGFKPLTDACQSGAPGSLRHCEMVLETLWEGDNMLDRAIALGLTRRLLLPLHPEQRTRWEPRAREYEALSQWYRNVAAQGLFPGASACDAQGELRNFLRSAAQLGEWEHGQAAMRAAGADDAVLSAQWRRENGRSVLDPTPVRR